MGRSIKIRTGVSFAAAASKLDKIIRNGGGITPDVAEQKARERIMAIVANPEAAIAELATKLAKRTPNTSTELLVATVAGCDSAIDRAQLAARYSLDVAVVEAAAVAIRTPAAETP